MPLRRIHAARTIHTHTINTVDNRVTVVVVFYSFLSLPRHTIIIIIVISYYTIIYYVPPSRTTDRMY